MQTLALMLAAVGSRSLVGIPLGIVGRPLRPLRARHHAGPRRDADHPRVRLPDADRDPLLGRAGRGGDHDDDLRHPAGDPHHLARRSAASREHGRGGAGDGLDAAAGPSEGAAPARTADAAPRRQPDDPVRALDGRHRRPHRRQGPRRRRDERAELVPGARDPRGDRDRRDGDGARPDHGGGRRANGSGPPSPHARPAPPAPARSRSPRPASPCAVVAVAALLGATAVYSRWTARDWILARIQSVLDYVGNPDTVLFRSRAGSATTSSNTGSSRCSDFLVLTPWFVVLAGFTAIALVVSGRRPALTTFLMLGLIGVIGQWEPAMDTASQVLVATVLAVAIGLGLGILAGREPGVLARASARERRACRRCPSSSTSSRSST